jgi:hypothetical protein
MHKFKHYHECCPDCQTRGSTCTICDHLECKPDTSDDPANKRARKAGYDVVPRLTPVETTKYPHYNITFEMEKKKKRDVDFENRAQPEDYEEDSSDYG